MGNLTTHQMRRHPIAAGLIMFIFGPYLLAFLLVVAAVAAAIYVLFAIIDVACGRDPFHWRP
jgi:hypothetical protein